MERQSQQSLSISEIHAFSEHSLTALLSSWHYTPVSPVTDGRVLVRSPIVRIAIASVLPLARTRFQRLATICNFWRPFTYLVCRFIQ